MCGFDGSKQITILYLCKLISISLIKIVLLYSWDFLILYTVEINTVHSGPVILTTFLKIAMLHVVLG
jgi:hypothetical protein